MATRIAFVGPRKWACLILLLSTCLGFADRLWAQSANETSLKFIPEDVAYYSAMLRNREQYEALANSKAIARIMQLPSIQMGVGLARLQWENPQHELLAAVKQFVDAAENQLLVQAVFDGLSNEIFFTGDDGFASLLEFANQLNTLNRVSQIEALTTGERSPEKMVERLLEALQEGLADQAVPNAVVGFKVSNEQDVRQQLERLENFLSATFEQQAPDLRSRLRRQSANGVEFLTFHLDGGLIPFDQIPLNDLGENREKFEDVIEQLKQSKAVIGLGVYQGYLLVTFGEDLEFVSQFGKKKLLANRDELKPLKKAAGKRLVGINYLSDELMQRISSSQGQIGDLVEIAEAAIPKAPLDDDLKEELISDLKKFAEAIEDYTPEAGAALGYSFLTDAGYEGYSYNWGENTRLDGSQPLSILNHLGGSPLMFLAGRGQSDPEAYDAFVEFAKRTFYYVEKGVIPQLDENDQSKFELVRNAVLPSIKRLDAITREFFIPGFKDSQAAIVIDADSTSKQWHLAMPVSENPLPMFEFALIAGVSDDSLVRQAFQNYFVTIQEVLDRLHAVEPNEVPEIKLPTPKSRDFSSGTIYYYSLPDSAGVDQQVAPSAGLGKKIAVATPFPKFAKRILDEAPPRGFGAPLGNPEHELAAATFMNFEGFVEAIIPWVDYGFVLAEQGQPNQGNAMMQAVRSQLSVVLSALKCFGSASSATYFEDDVAVTHFEWRVHDLD